MQSTSFVTSNKPAEKTYIETSIETQNSIPNTTPTTDYLRVDNLSVSFGSTEVVKSLSMQLVQGEIGCLLGFSGCGKTTALRAIAGLEQPTQGLISLNHKVLTHLQNHRTNIQVMPAKRGMGMVFQDYALFNHLSVQENIGFGLNRWDKSQRKSRIEEMLVLVELTDHAHKRINELSGGQQQRVALARALAPKPDLLLLDEPFSNLDMMLRETLARKVRDILKQTNTTAILVTHDQHEAFAIADKIGVMTQGKIAQWATPDELYHRPNSPFIAEFIGEGAFIDGVINQGVIKTALGNIKRYPDPIHSHEGRHTLGSEHIDVPQHTDKPQKISNSVQSLQHTSSPQVMLNPDQSIINQNESRYYDYPNGTKIKVLIRPDDIVHDDASPQTAIVTERVFRGANFLYRLQLNSGEEVLSLVSSHHEHPIGSAIGFRPVLAHVVLFKADELNANIWHSV